MAAHSVFLDWSISSDFWKSWYSSKAYDHANYSDTNHCIRSKGYPSCLWTGFQTVIRLAAYIKQGLDSAILLVYTNYDGSGSCVNRKYMDSSYRSHQRSINIYAMAYIRSTGELEFWYLGSSNRSKYLGRSYIRRRKVFIALRFIIIRRLGYFYCCGHY